MGAYADLGARLIEYGYGAVPIMPGTKRPGFLFAGQWIGLANWQRRFNGGVPSATELARWEAGDTGLGVVGGYNGLVAIDVDSDDDTYWDALLPILPPSPVHKIGAKGETFFYYGPDIKQSQSWDIGKKRVVDLIGPGRQTVLPPTIHPATHESYYWSTEETLEDLQPHELPLLPADIAEQITAALTPLGYRPVPALHIVGSGEGDSPYRALNEQALANLAAWVPALNLYRCRPARGGYEAVPLWRPSTTGRPSEKRHLNLKIVPAGIRDFGADQGYTPIDLVMAACGCDCDTAFKFLAEKIGFGVDIDVSGLVPVQEPVRVASETTQPAPAPVGEQPALGARPEPAQLQPALPKQASAIPEDELAPFTTVPGLVGNIVDWITATSRRPNRVLALGAAITVVGTLIGRRVAGPTNSATHLYAVSIARSGAGKQHILDAAIRLMRAANAEAHIGPSRFHSGSAIFQRLKSMPVMLCMQDEIGGVLRAITNRKAGTHDRQTGELLRSLWGLSFASLAPPAWATIADMIKVVACPAVSILGVSTPDEFVAALQGESVDNGLLNRFLALSSTVRVGDTNPAQDPLTVPVALAHDLGRLYLWSGPESLLQISNPEVAHTPEVLAWASTGAEAHYADFARIVENHTDEHPGSAPYLARCVETSIRLATIRAAGRWGRGGRVDLDDMEWGTGIAWLAANSLATMAQDYIAENERSEMTAKLLGLIRRRGEMSRRDIQQWIRSRIRSQDLKDILGQLVEAGEITQSGQVYRPAGWVSAYASV
jgi:Bifunctional DNA primase/polymerase, N-terminal/Protein of unknown function (DUF3987)